VEGQRDIAERGEPNQQEPHAYQLVGSKRKAARRGVLCGQALG
jgi:hypothetical protein